MGIITIGTVIPHFGEEGQYFFTCRKDSSILLGGNFFLKVALLSYESPTMCKRIHMEPE